MGDNYLLQRGKRMDVFVEHQFKIGCIYFCCRSVPHAMPAPAWMPVDALGALCQRMSMKLLSECPTSAASWLHAQNPFFPPQSKHSFTTSGFLQVLPAEFPQALAGWNTGSLISQHSSACIPWLAIHLCCLSDCNYIAGQFNVEATWPNSLLY